MDTLLIGNSSVLSKESLRKVFTSQKEDMCLVCSDDIKEPHSGRVRYLRTPKGMDGYNFLFEKNRFDNVIYLSEFLTPDHTSFHEIENLGAALASASLHAGRVSRFIYVIPAIRIPENEDENFEALCLSASLSLFLRYRKELAGKTSFAILRVPYVTGSLTNGDFLTRLFEAADKKHALILPWPPDMQIPLLYEADLAEFFVRFLDLWDGKYSDFVLNPSKRADPAKSSVASFAEALGAETGCEVKTGSETDADPLMAVSEENNIARKEYGWYAKTDLSEVVHTLHSKYESLRPKVEKHFLFSKHIPRKILIGLELIAGTAVTQVLISISGGSVQFRMIDYRLLFVVIMATMYGSNVGFYAALIMSGSLFWAYRQQGISGIMLLYETVNWIPFILLFGVSAVCGYARQSLRDRIRVLEKDREELYAENAALSSLYDDAARTRDNYRQDLMMSQNSFGKIFEVVQKLNYLRPDAIYHNAVPILEEILETNSVAIYDISDYDAVFARLEVCSPEKRDVYRRSIRLSDRPEIVQALQKGELWINRQAKPQLPCYIAGITDEDGHLAIAVIIGSIPFERMTGYYANIVRVLVGIMQSFLLRAFHYTREQKERYYYPGTILMKEDAFAQRFEQIKEMAHSGLTSWRLLQIDGEGSSASEWDSLLAGKARTTDDICLGDDGNVYLLLNQVDEKTENIVLRRYQSYGFSCRFTENLPRAGKEQNI